MRRWFVLAGVVALSACGSSGHAQPSNNTEEFCARAKAYQAATSTIDFGTVQSTLDGFSKSALAARAMADVAPPAVRKQSDRVASAAQELVAKLRERHPRTDKEFAAAGQEVVAALNAKYSNLDADTSAVKAAASKTCGITFA